MRRKPVTRCAGCNKKRNTLQTGEFCCACNFKKEMEIKEGPRQWYIINKE